MNENKRISIIGNNNEGEMITDGGRIKIRLFKSLLLKEGYDVNIIDLCNWKKNFLKIISQTKKAINNQERIIIMAGPKGSRLIIPLVYHLNKKHKSNVVFCPVGIGSIDSVVRNLNKEQLNDFLLSRNFSSKHDRKFSKYLSSFESVVVENKVLESCYRNFYGIDNTNVLTNFRILNEPTKRNGGFDDDNLHCVFLSRVCLEKGIVDLVNAVNNINNSSKQKIYLDVYGDIQLNEPDAFLSNTNEFICYKGLINQKDSYDVLSTYDLFVLPTKYYGEGTPGSLVESLIAGTPVLVSNYSQAKELIIDGYNGFVFEMDSLDDLIKSLSNTLKHKKELIEMRANAVESSKQFIYNNVKSVFLRLIGGKVE